MLKRYTRRVEIGKLNYKLEEVSQSVETSQKLKPTTEGRNEIATENTFQLQEFPANSTPITNHLVSWSWVWLLRPITHKIPSKGWVRAWALQDEGKSFKIRISNEKVRSSSSKKQVKRRKVDLKTNVITINQLLVELKQKEQEDEEK